MNSLGIDKEPGKTRVVVAMSGGVDSSTTAALLAREGYDVVGVTMQLYDYGAAVAKKGACCAGQDIFDAGRVAAVIGIPHYVLDYESRFREDVIETFADSYVRGETPIPCVLCNQTVKFRDLLVTAKDLGAEALATGHYVRRVMAKDGLELHRAADGTKDQSYFLFATTAEQLAYLRFPLGDLAKDETRDLAARFDLPVAAKPDSQDICFVPEGRYGELVAKLRPSAAEPGDIIHVDGRVLGTHDGIIHYTVGQRRGLQVGGDVGGGEPLYVVRIEPASNRVVVGSRRALDVAEVQLAGVNWLGAEPAGGKMEIQVKLRSTQPLAAATLRLDGSDGARVQLHQPQPGIAPGQACVFYDGGRVLGGGWIQRQPAAVGA